MVFCMLIMLFSQQYYQQHHVVSNMLMSDSTRISGAVNEEYNFPILNLLTLVNALVIINSLNFGAVTSYSEFITSNTAVIIEVTEMKTIQGSTPAV